MLSAQSSDGWYFHAGSDHRMLAMDDTNLRMPAYQRDDVIGPPEHDLTFLADRHLSFELLTKLKRDRQPFALTKRYVRGDNTLI